MVATSDSPTSQQTVLVRYSPLRYLGVFSSSQTDLKTGDKVVIQSDRGTEFGEVVSAPQTSKGGKLSGTLLRAANTGDKDKAKRLEDVDARSSYKYCLEAIRRHKLDMRLTEVEHLLGGEKVIFYFVSPERVDFRELVRDLAREYRTRIEMRQIGVRDEARILGDYEACGQKLCCRSHLTNIDPVSIKMAKNQAMTLEPGKLAGRCGRLKCCLRYEDPVYTELKKCLPRHGSMIETEDGPAKVIGTDILGLEVTVSPEGSEGRKNVRAVELKKDCGSCSMCHH